jgi:hypothetical protein
MKLYESICEISNLPNKSIKDPQFCKKVINLLKLDIF